ncbi:M14 family metallopeptidase [Acidobacteriota bacterium]
MRTLMKQTLVLALAVLLLSVSAYSANFKEHKVTIPLRFDYYYTLDMVAEALKKLHKTFPTLTKLEVVNKSEEGRPLYCMTVNNPKTGKELDKPGILVDGNIHGNEIQGGEVCLYILDYLLENYGTNKELTALVDKNCFYVLPVINPDGRYHFLAEEKQPDSSNRGLRRPHDDDGDDLLDEDMDDDLDGDGSICRMRKRDPEGFYTKDPEDPRILVPVKPGKKGQWTLLDSEGIDNDGDGFINEDGESFVDPNRNWGYNWNPHYVQHGAGDYPFSGVGLKAMARYIRKRTNICLYWSFHNTGGMFLRGPALKAEGEYPRQDVEIYDFIDWQGERMTPGYRYIVLWKDLYETYGDSLSWMTNINGAFGFVAELFMVKHETFKTLKEKKAAEMKAKEEGAMEGIFGNGTEVQKKRLKFNDHLTQGELFKPWKPFKHPTLGDIEIGGWTKLSSRISHPFMLKDLVHRNASVVLFSAKHTPEVKMQIFEIKKIGKDLFRVRVRLENKKAIPSMSRYAEMKKLYPKDMLTISGKNLKVSTGDLLTDVYRDRVTYKEYRPEIQFLSVPGFGKVEYQFLVAGKKGAKATIKYNSRHAGKISKTIELK